MATHNLNSMQFHPPGDDEAKQKLYDELRTSFKKKDLEWLKDDQIRVDAPKKISPEAIDWDDYPDWRACRQLKEVRDIAKKLEKGKKPKPIVLADSGDDTMFIVDGHHHALAQVDHKDKPKAYVMHVPSKEGPWTTLHDKQKGDTRKDDFGKTDNYDRND